MLIAGRRGGKRFEETMWGRRGRGLAPSRYRGARDELVRRGLVEPGEVELCRTAAGAGAWDRGDDAARRAVQ